jgi:Ni/Fe-hydrogenase b-type cytochrome subunit
MSALVYRHNRITRLTHWVNTLALLILFMSGLQIFNAYPNLHWGSKAEPDEAFFSIFATNEDGGVRGYTQFYGLRVETTGWLGLQNTEMGPFPRAFPSWLTIPGYFWLAGGRRWHFFFAWVFVLNGLLYFLYNLATGHVRKFVLTPRDTKKIFPMVLYYLRLRRESPQEGEYNPLQKIAYTGVFFILTPLIILSGMAMSPQLDVAFNWLPAMFGGRQSARSVHFILTFLFAAFTLGHICMVMTTGIFNNMRSIISGWYTEKTQLLPETMTTEPAAQEIIELPDAIVEQADTVTAEEQETKASRDEGSTLNPETVERSERDPNARKENPTDEEK